MTHNGALFVQGGEGAGTGTFAPFLTLSANDGDEKGYNTTAASAEFDTFTGGGRTKPLLASAIPTVLIDGVLYREFSLDANDQGADDYMSIDALKIFLDDQQDLTDFETNLDTFGTDNSTTATLIYDLDAGGETTVLMRSQSLTPGSGVSDITVFIPDSLFPANCAYGSTNCTSWVYFYTESGYYTGTDPVSGTQNWNVTGGFEEWRTRLLPVVNVTKTAVPSATRTYDWTLVKEISIDGGGTWHDSRTVNLFTGQSQGYLWRLTWTRDAGTVSGAQVIGDITITNPTGGSVITTSIDAVIDNVTDVLTLGSSTYNLTTTSGISCPVTFPYTLKAQQTLTCTYSKTGVNTDDGTNVATVTLAAAGNSTNVFSSPAVPVTWAAATTEVDETASINDPLVPGLNQTGLTGSGSFTSSAQSYTCGGDTTITNNATLTEGDSGETRPDSASLTVDCHGLTVSKTANATFTRSYDWTLVKEVSLDGTTWVDAATVNLFNGQSQNYQWRLSWTRDAGTDSAWTVSGTITITNASPIAATGVSVTDVLSIDGAATVNCGGGATTVNVPAKVGDVNGSATCTYTKALGAATNQNNTATATLASTPYNSSAVAVTFSATPTTEVDATASISDPDAGLNQTGLTGNSSATSATQSYTCGSDTTITNSATLTESGGQERTDSASLTVDCHGLTVGKTANTTFTRTYDWTLVKEISIDGGTSWHDSRTVDLFTGQSQSYLWKLTWTRNVGTDSAWAVSGTITITNASPIAANNVSVSDVLSIDGAATVDCGGGATTVNVPAKSGTVDGTATCTYTKNLASAASQTNTATATFASTSYNSSAVPVTFSATPTTEVDATASISDPDAGLNQTGLTGNGSATSATQSYTCGTDTTITNTATLTESGGQERTDASSLTVDCHGLTVGKTANTTFTRTYHWTIDKDSTDPAALTLNAGNTYSYPYRVTVQLAGTPYTDSAWAVSGTITITNASPIAANNVSVTDALSIDGAATVDCGGGATTANVPAKVGDVNGTATCTYSLSLASAASQTNTATATFAGTAYSSSAVPVTFSSTPTTQVDECITVTDSLQGSLGTACFGTDTLPKTFSYSRTIGPYTDAQCGTQTVNNTATFTTNDTSTTGTDSWTVTVTIPCPTGCTLTQGYWKTHSSFGPAPEDTNWTTPTNSDPLNQFGPTDTFFLSDKTYYQVMWTAPKGGNAYYILAHQYIAAKLNIRAGAATTAAVDAAILFAEEFFAAADPTVKLSKDDRAAVIAAASTLASYNEGDIGPGHCSEDSIAQNAP